MPDSVVRLSPVLVSGTSGKDEVPGPAGVLVVEDGVMVVTGVPVVGDVGATWRGICRLQWAKWPPHAHLPVEKGPIRAQGRMLRFTRNRFDGSYVALIVSRRS